MAKKKTTHYGRFAHRGQARKPCFFCQEKQEPNFKELEVLRRFTTERGKIIGRGKTGICRKHQRALTIAVKRARILALLPFVVRAR